MLSTTDRDAALDAFLKALMTHAYTDISLRDIAQQANIPLAKLAMTITSKLDLVEAFAKRVDEEVLQGDDPEMADEPARERLFDVMMRRYDALLPHKLALIQLEKDARRDPLLGLALIRIAGRSLRKMALAADIDLGGPEGPLILAGLTTLHGRVMRVWLAETDAGQAHTMAELDKGLRQAERRMGDVEGLTKALRGGGMPDFSRFSGGPLCRLREQMEARRTKRDADKPVQAEADNAQPETT